MTSVQSAAALVAEAHADARVMLSTTVVGSATGPKGQQVLVAEPCYTFANTGPQDGCRAGTDSVVMGPCMRKGRPAKTALSISDSLAASRLVQRLPQESQQRTTQLQPFSAGAAGQLGFAARRGFRAPPGLSAFADTESEGSKADSDGRSTADTSHVPSPTGGDGSRLAASCPGSPAGRLAPEASNVPVLRLESALPQGLLGLPELPSEGSRWHQLGTCKPCAFVFKGGCSNGVACSFCHLCPPGEKKVRKQVRKTFQRGPGMWQEQ